MNIASIHYINLGRRADRRIHIEACLSGAPVTPQRVSAIELDEPPEARGISMRSPHQGNRSIASIFLSHRNALKAALTQEAQGIAVIIEDDCHIASDLWNDPLTLCNVPNDWQLVLLNPRFRKHGTPATRPKLSFWSRLNPFRQKYWCRPLRPYEAKSTKILKDDYVISGAHFLIFRNKVALELALSLMDRAEEIYHVDHFLSEEMPNCYAVASKMVQASGFGSDNRP